MAFPYICPIRPLFPSTPGGGRVSPTFKISSQRGVPDRFCLCPGFGQTRLPGSPYTFPHTRSENFLGEPQRGEKIKRLPCQDHLQSQGHHRGSIVEISASRHLSSGSKNSGGRLLQLSPEHRGLPKQDLKKTIKDDNANNRSVQPGENRLR